MLMYILESKIFRQISAKLLPKTKMQHYCGDLVSGWAVQLLVNRISLKTLK